MAAFDGFEAHRRLRHRRDNPLKDNRLDRLLEFLHVFKELFVRGVQVFDKLPLGSAKTLADFEINTIAAALPPLFCSNSWPCFDLLCCPSKRCFASCGRAGASLSRISRYANNSPC